MLDMEIPLTRLFLSVKVLTPVPQLVMRLFSVPVRVCVTPVLTLLFAIEMVLDMVPRSLWVA